MRGLVIRNTGSWYQVLPDEGGPLIDCKIKGNFRLRGIRSTNPIAVGDRVQLLPTSEGTAFIIEIEERKNYIVRRSTNLSKQSHILAANVDLCLLLVTVARPATSTTFIDRFLASAEAYNVPVTLLFNKVDELSSDELHYQEAVMHLYSHIGYSSYAVSALRGDGLEALRELLLGQTSLLAGHSGVGKSTLINTLLPDARQKTSAISVSHLQGTHTTTFSEMFPIDTQGGYLIDTPGVRGFGTFDFKKEEVGHYFKEIFETSHQCRFSDCSHRHEPGCAVCKAVEEHQISESRYASYLSILDDNDEGKYREKQ